MSVDTYRRIRERERERSGKVNESDKEGVTLN